MVLRAGITLALVLYLGFKIDLSIFVHRLSSAKGIWLLAALALVMVQIALASVRWDYVIAAIHGRIGFQRCFRYVLEGQFFSQVLPSSVGGDIVRVLQVHREGLPTGTAATTVLLDRLSALAAVLLAVAVTVPILMGRVEIPGFAAGIASVLAVSASGFVLLFTMDRLLKLPLSWRLTRLLHQLAVDCRTLLAQPVLALLVIGYSFVILFLSAFILFLLGRSLDIGLGFTSSLVFTPLIILFMTLPISIAGWGVREISMVVLLDQIGIMRTDAIALSVTFGLALLVTSIPGGILWIFDPQAKHPSEDGSDGQLLSHNSPA